MERNDQIFSTCFALWDIIEYVFHNAKTNIRDWIPWFPNNKTFWCVWERNKERNLIFKNMLRDKKKVCICVSMFLHCVKKRREYQEIFSHQCCCLYLGWKDQIFSICFYSWGIIGYLPYNAKIINRDWTHSFPKNKNTFCVCKINKNRNLIFWKYFKGQ